VRARVNTVMNHRVPLNVLKFLTNCTTGGFTRRVQLHEVGNIFGTRTFVMDRFCGLVV
jgi:hypothetical protein